MFDSADCAKRAAGTRRATARKDRIVLMDYTSRHVDIPDVVGITKLMAARNSVCVASRMALSPRLLELLRHIIPPRIRHLGIFHGRLNVRVSDPVLDPLHAKALAQ